MRSEPRSHTAGGAEDGTTPPRAPTRNRRCSVKRSSALSHALTCTRAHAQRVYRATLAAAAVTGSPRIARSPAR